MGCDEARREFLELISRMMGGAAIAAVVVPAAGGCEPSYLHPTDPTGGGSGNEAAFDAAQLPTVGAIVATSSTGPDGFSILLARTGQTEYMAMSMRCTHQSCSVRDTLSNDGRIVCPCHGSKFAIDGAVVQGPANEPLKRYPTRYDDATNRVIVTIA